MKNFKRISLPGGLKSGHQLKSTKILKNTKTIAAVFPRGSKKRKSNNDDKHGHCRGSKKRKSNNDDKRGHCQEKRRPSTLRWGRKMLEIISKVNLSFEGVFSDVRGPTRTQNLQQPKNKWSVRKLFTFLGHFCKQLKKKTKIHLTYVPT